MHSESPEQQAVVADRSTSGSTRICRTFNLRPGAEVGTRFPKVSGE